MLASERSGYLFLTSTHLGLRCHESAHPKLVSSLEEHPALGVSESCVKHWGSIFPCDSATAVQDRYYTETAVKE